MILTAIKTKADTFSRQQSETVHINLSLVSSVANGGFNDELKIIMNNGTTYVVDPQENRRVIIDLIGHDGLMDVLQ